MKKFNYLNKNGFTLMELLITVILVAVLASYSVYYYNNTIDEGKLNAAKGKLAALGGAVERYKIENIVDDVVFLTTEINLAQMNMACNMSDLEHIRDLNNVFRCGYADKSLGLDENFRFFFGSPHDSLCGGDNVGSVFMIPKSGVTSEVYPHCAYFDPNTDKVREKK